MCDNTNVSNCGCECVDLNEGVSVAPVNRDLVKESLEQHIQEREEFDRQIKAANEETDRFRELYTAVFGIVIEKQDIELLQKVNSKSAEIELKYIKG